jgi:Lrp/AsnC family transcriptional regulator
MNEELSTLDIRILDQLQRDASLSTSDLAEKVGLSQSPCWRRLQKLKDDGYIRQQVAILERAKFGESIYVFATIKMAPLSDQQRADFYRKIDLAPEILECHTVFGELDVIIKVIASSLTDYQNFIFNVILELPGVVDIQSTATVTEIKNSTAIPIRGKRSL